MRVTPAAYKLELSIIHNVYLPLTQKREIKQRTEHTDRNKQIPLCSEDMFGVTEFINANIVKRALPWQLNFEKKLH